MRNSNYTTDKNGEINLLIKTFFGLVEMMFGLVNVSFSLPEWQAVKMTLFAPCFDVKLNTQAEQEYDVRLFLGY